MYFGEPFFHIRLEYLIFCDIKYFIGIGETWEEGSWYYQNGVLENG